MMYRWITWGNYRLRALTATDNNQLTFKHHTATRAGPSRAAGLQWWTHEDYKGGSAEDAARRGEPPTGGKQHGVKISAQAAWSENQCTAPTHPPDASLKGAATTNSNNGTTTTWSARSSKGRDGHRSTGPDSQLTTIPNEERPLDSMFSYGYEISCLTCSELLPQGAKTKKVSNKRSQAGEHRERLSIAGWEP